MLNPVTIRMRRLIRLTTVSVLLIAVAGLTFASKGGGGDKKKTKDIPYSNTFTPIHTTNGFTLKAGPSFRGSYLLGQEKTKNYLAFNTLVTYQKGNSIFILPYKYRINTSTFFNSSNKTNLQLLDLRIKMHK